MMRDHYYTKDHPTANGRKPIAGEHAYSFLFPLQDGNELEIHCGDETMAKFAEFIGSMTIDDAAEGASAPAKRETTTTGESVSSVRHKTDDTEGLT